jgi:hypothetical protein
MPNDIIKLGRVRFKVREMVSPEYARKQSKAYKKLKVIKRANGNSNIVEDSNMEEEFARVNNDDD